MLIHRGVAIVLFQCLLVVARQYEHFAIFKRLPRDGREDLRPPKSLQREDHDPETSLQPPARPQFEHIRQFTFGCLDCSPKDSRIPVSIRDAFHHHRQALKGFEVRMTQGTHLFHNGRNLEAEDATRLIYTVQSGSMEADRKALAQRLPALVDALIGTSLQSGSSAMEQANSTYTYQVHDERICNENLWRLYKMAPCRSLGGVLALAKPEMLRDAFGKKIAIDAFRSSEGLLSISTTLTLSETRVVNETVDETYPDIETCALADSNVVTLRDETGEGPPNALRGESDLHPGVNKWGELIERAIQSDQVGELEKPKMTLIRSELSKDDCVRCGGILKYELHSHSASVIGSEIEVSDRWHAFMRPSNLLDAVWRCDGKDYEVKYDIVASRERPRTRDVIFRVPLAGSRCSIRLEISKEMPMWSDFTYLYEGGWELPAPIYRVVGDDNHSTKFGVTANWLLFPIVDITAFFNTVTFASLAAMMLYSRSVKEAVLPTSL